MKAAIGIHQPIQQLEGSKATTQFQAKI
jgi:hypothetical protein